jgi:hypothetical protein
VNCPLVRELRKLVAFALLTVAIVVAVTAFVLPRFGRDRRLQEVDRFHRAGQITSDWARAGVTRPVLVDDAAPRDDADPADALGAAARRETAAAHR